MGRFAERPKEKIISKITGLQARQFSLAFRSPIGYPSKFGPACEMVVVAPAVFLQETFRRGSASGGMWMPLKFLMPGGMTNTTAMRVIMRTVAACLKRPAQTSTRPMRSDDVA